MDTVINIISTSSESFQLVRVGYKDACSLMSVLKNILGNNLAIHNLTLVIKMQRKYIEVITASYQCQMQLTFNRKVNCLTCILNVQVECDSLYGYAFIDEEAIETIL